MSWEEHVVKATKFFWWILKKKLQELDASKLRKSKCRGNLKSDNLLKQLTKVNTQNVNKTGIWKMQKELLSHWRGKNKRKKTIFFKNKKVTEVKCCEKSENKFFSEEKL